MRSLKQKIAIAVGTRPEIIKMAPIIREIQRKNYEYYIIHSGQHYSYNLDEVFFEQLKLPKPKYRLEVGSKSPGEQTALIISGSEKIFQKERPSVVLVQGDTNTVLGIALAARKMNIPIGHIEAGLRSYDEAMPEEWNRILTDHCSDYLFAPTKNSKKILLREGIKNKKIFVTGNTIVDSVFQNQRYVKFVVELPELKRNSFFLASLHRQENVDNPERFREIIEGLKLVSEKFGLPIVYPIHPRSEKMAKKFGISFGTIKIIEPMNYFAFLHMELNARLILTDSGGVQEEACILKVPCVTLRNNTERPETVQVGANIVSGVSSRSILRCTKKMMQKKRVWKNPFGDGNSAKKIIQIITHLNQNI